MKNIFKQNVISLITTLVIIAYVLISFSRHYKIRSNENPYPIAWDVYGYYLYLPATFIYNDPGLENEDWIKKTQEKYKPSSTFYQVVNGEGNKKIIVYNIGYAIINAPAFFIANSLAPSMGYEKDGFSKPYQLALLYTAMLFTIMGVFLLRKISLHFFSDKLTSFLLLIVVLGTNYFYQATYDGVMPHNILFTLNCCIIWFTIKWHENKTLKNIILLSFFIGLATICRPTELLWGLVPVFWNVTNRKLFFEKIVFLFKNYLQLISACLLLFILLGIQLLYYKYTSNHFLLYNLHNESFSFLEPYTFDFLFSYKKGWLLYTPIMIFAIIGFWHLRNYFKNIWFSLFIYFIINLYVTSSWECWWYAASFSQRPMVESYCLMLFPLGGFLLWIQKRKYILVKLSFAVVILLFVLLNQFQVWQYKYGIISTENMTKEYYWKIFLKTSVAHEDRQYLSIERWSDTFTDFENYKGKYYRKELYYNDFENETGANTIDTTASSGKKSLMLNSQNPFSPAFEDEYYNITHKSYGWVKVHLNVYLTAPYQESNSAIVISTEAKGKSYKYLTSNYDHFKTLPGSWNKIHLDYITPIIRHRHDKLKVYFWNMGNKPVLIDDFRVEFFEPIKDYQ